MFNGIRMANRFGDLQKEMDRLLDGIGIGVVSTSGRATGFPPVNMWDDDANVFVEAEVPGVKRDDIEILLTGDELTIKGHREFAKGDDVVYQRRERGTGEFVRVIEMPVDVDGSGIDARLADGVLTVRLPKAAAAMPRKIEVKVG